MKKLLFAILFYIPIICFSQVSRDFMNPVNVQWFTGVPDGIKDNTVGFNAAIGFCYAQRRPQLFIPAALKHYIINTATSGVDMLTLPNDTLGFHMYGEVGTYIESNSKVNNLLDVVNGPHVGIEIDHIYFLSTHDTTNQGTTCLLFQGFNPNIIRNVKIHDCAFDGWSTDIVLKGVQNGHIYNNTEVSPLGHDNGTNTPVPNVGILSVVDSVGDENKNIEINGNWASGYTGTGPITALKTHGPKDGWFYGPASGFNIHDNFTFNYGREHIVIQPSIVLIDSSVTRVELNMIDCRMPPGSANTTNVKLTTVYGIRAEAQNIVIAGNTIYNAPIGIFFDATPWNFVFRSPFIHNNYIYGATDTAMNPSYGIYIKGFATGTRSKFGNITNNHIILDAVTLKQTYKAISCTFFDSSFISDNNVIQTRLAEIAGGTTGIFLSSSDGTVLGINQMKGIDTFLVALSSTYAHQLLGLPSKIAAGTDSNVIRDPSGKLWVAPAASGTVLTQNSVIGDGSSGNKLQLFNDTSFAAAPKPPMMYGHNTLRQGWAVTPVDYINVVWYGVDTTGANGAANLVIVQNLLNTTKRTLYFPAGKIALPGTLYINKWDSVHIIGAGPNTTIVGPTNDTLFYVRKNFCEFNGFSIKATFTGGITGGAIFVDSATGTNVHDMNFDSVDVPFHVAQTIAAGTGENGNRFHDNKTFSAFRGVWNDTRGEFTNIFGNEFTKGYTGIYSTGGNFDIHGNIFLGQNTASMDFENGSNDTHGRVDGNICGHNTASLIVNNISVWQEFSNNTFSVGNITITNSPNITFFGGEIDLTGTTLTVDSSSVFFDHVIRHALGTETYLHHATALWRDRRDQSAGTKNYAYRLQGVVAGTTLQDRYLVDTTYQMLRLDNPSISGSQWTILDSLGYMDINTSGSKVLFHNPVQMSDGSVAGGYNFETGSIFAKQNGATLADPFKFWTTDNTGAASTLALLDKNIRYFFRAMPDNSNFWFGDVAGTPSIRPTALLHMQDTAKGVIFPRLTTARINAIPTGVNDDGLWLYDSLLHVYKYWNGNTAAWVTLSTGSTNIYNTNGTLTGDRDLAGASHNLNVGTVGSPLGTYASNANGGFIFNAGTGANAAITFNGRPQYSLDNATDANYTLASNAAGVFLPAITANRTATFPGAGNAQTGEVFYLVNHNTSGNTWTFSPTLKDAAGNTISTLANGTSYIIVWNGANYEILGKN